MFAVVTPEKIQLPPGTVMRLLGNWQDYKTLKQQLGDRPFPRLKYRHGELFLMSPLPDHGRKAAILANIVRVILEHLGKEYDEFTPITLELPEESGIEPDYCFYIDNWQAVSGKARINWTIDPPPDLVIEVDIASYTDVNDYLPYRVPEIWLLKGEELSIYRLQENSYQVVYRCAYFPIIKIIPLVRSCLQTAYQRNTSTAVRELRRKLSEGELN